MLTKYKLNVNFKIKILSKNKRLQFVKCTQLSGLIGLRVILVCDDNNNGNYKEKKNNQIDLEQWVER